MGLHPLLVGSWGIFEGSTLRPRKEMGGKDGGAGTEAQTTAPGLPSPTPVPLATSTQKTR